jgi:hypothetical protein
VADDVLISVRDRRDRELIVLARIWTDKILRDHPEMAGYLGSPGIVVGEITGTFVRVGV